ncbi:MAG: helix-turn-helix transcriptional regulator [Henriciella sp.]
MADVGGKMASGAQLLESAHNVQSLFARCDSFDSLERSALEQILEFIRADAAIVISRLSGLENKSVVLPKATLGVDLELMQEYVETYHSDDPVTRFANTLSKRPVKKDRCSVFRLSDTCQEDLLRSSPYYKNFLGATGINDILVFSLPIDQSGDEHLIMGVHRIGDERKFDPDDLSRAKLIAPVIGGSLMRIALQERIAAQSTALSVLNSWNLASSALVIFDRKSNIVDAYGLAFDDEQVARAHLRSTCRKFIRSGLSNLAAGLDDNVSISGARTKIEFERKGVDEDSTFYLATCTPTKHRAMQKKLDQWGLTRREKQVAEGLLEGGRNADISNALGITVKTVENHMSSIFSKVGVACRTELIAAIVTRASNRSN